jgi:hypothetical protein
MIHTTQKIPGHREKFQGGFNLRPKLHAKHVIWDPQWGFDGTALYIKT